MTFLAGVSVNFTFLAGVSIDLTSSAGVSIDFTSSAGALVSFISLAGASGTVTSSFGAPAVFASSAGVSTGAPAVFTSSTTVDSTSFAGVLFFLLAALALLAGVLSDSSGTTSLGVSTGSIGSILAVFLAGVDLAPLPGVTASSTIFVLLGVLTASVDGVSTSVVVFALERGVLGFNTPLVGVFGSAFKAGFGESNSIFLTWERWVFAFLASDSSFSMAASSTVNKI